MRRDGKRWLSLMAVKKDWVCCRIGTGDADRSGVEGHRMCVKGNMDFFKGGGGTYHDRKRSFGVSY